MTDLEIDQKLALAIGWKACHVETDKAGNTQLWIEAIYVKGWTFVKGSGTWRVFSHKDWNVIGPIAERYDCFTYKNSSGVWVSSLTCGGHYEPAHLYCGDTPQKAIALAVIGGNA